MTQKRHAVLRTLYFVLCALCFSLLGTSCSEKSEASEYDNWQSRNAAYIDSVATAARLNADGSWTMYRAFNLGDSLYMNGDNNHYVYVQKLEHGTGTYSPQYNDSIRVHYSGRLIPSSTYPTGYNFGKSYTDDVLDLQTDVPSLMCVNQNVIGFATAVMNMVEGDRWRIVVPYYLGYGKTNYTSANIPGYSTLIFDVRLARIYRYKIDTDCSWW